MLLAIVMAASFAFVPVAALAATVIPVGSSTQILSETTLGDDPSMLERFIGGNEVQRISFTSHGFMQFIVSLEGRSLSAEQAFRQASGLPALDGTGQRAYVAALRAAQAPFVASFGAAGARILHSYQIVYNGIAISADLPTLQKIGTIPGVRRIAATAIYEIQLDNSIPFIFGGKTNAQLGADGTGVSIAITPSS